MTLRDLTAILMGDPAARVIVTPPPPRVIEPRVPRGAGRGGPRACSLTLRLRALAVDASIDDVTYGIATGAQGWYVDSYVGRVRLKRQANGLYRVTRVR